LTRLRFAVGENALQDDELRQRQSHPIRQAQFLALGWLAEKYAIYN
jgi:hypothetical protein